MAPKWPMVNTKYPLWAEGEWTSGVGANTSIFRVLHCTAHPLYVHAGRVHFTFRVLTAGVGNSVSGI